MTLILKQLFAFIKLLNSETGENQIAAGIACGLVLGFAPGLSLQTILIFSLIFFFRIQLGSALISAFFFKILSYTLDPIFDITGQKILEIEGLRPLYESLYQLPIVPFTRFYNSIVMGSAVIGLILFPFVFIAAKMLIVKYRSTILERFQSTKLWKAVKATSFYKWYAKYDELYN